MTLVAAKANYIPRPFNFLCSLLRHPTIVLIIGTSRSGSGLLQGVG